VISLVNRANFVYNLVHYTDLLANI
jgi:hypothetical protein